MKPVIKVAGEIETAPDATKGNSIVIAEGSAAVPVQHVEEVLQEAHLWK